jgi:hypothetical protein
MLAGEKLLQGRFDSLLRVADIESIQRKFVHLPRLLWRKFRVLRKVRNRSSIKNGRRERLRSNGRRNPAAPDNGYDRPHCAGTRPHPGQGTSGCKLCSLEAWCRSALQGGTRPPFKFNSLDETEMPFRAFQLRLARAYLALEMELVDRSMDRGIFDRNVGFVQGIPSTALPFQSRLRAPESHMQ